MPEPKKQSSARKTGLRRSHLRLKLARSVNKTSPVKAYETRKQTPRLKVKTAKPASKTSVKARKAAKSARTIEKGVENAKRKSSKK